MESERSAHEHRSQGYDWRNGKCRNTGNTLTDGTTQGSYTAGAHGGSAEQMTPHFLHVVKAFPVDFAPDDGGAQRTEKGSDDH